MTYQDIRSLSGLCPSDSCTYGPPPSHTKRDQSHPTILAQAPKPFSPRQTVYQSSSSIPISSMGTDPLGLSPFGYWPVFRTITPRRVMRLAGWPYYIKNRGASVITLSVETSTTEHTETPLAARKAHGRIVSAKRTIHTLRINAFSPFPVVFCAFSACARGVS